MATKNTKNRIKAEALRQFNANGVERVTIRSIAEALAMSPGNLTYHYKNPDVLIYELYLDLVQAIDQTIIELNHRTLDLSMLYEQLLSNQRKMFRHRFLLLEFATIGRRVEAVRLHFRHLVNNRQGQFQFVLRGLAEAGYLRSDLSDGTHVEMILQSIIFSNAWLTDAFLHFDRPDERVIPFYARLQMAMLKPYLTQRGLEEYLTLLEDGEEFDGYPE